MKRQFLCWIACGLLGSTGPAVAGRPSACARLSTNDLRCDYLVNPLGIDNVHPALSWKLASTAAGRRGLGQSAYQVLVASERSLLDQDHPDLWDSGRVESQQSIHVPLPRQNATGPLAMLVEGPVLGRAWPGFRLERAGILVDGSLADGGLAGGKVDRIGPWRK